MYKLKKIVETIAIFIVIMLLICFCISAYKVFINDIEASEIVSKTGLYFLYTIGYGALEGDAVLQNVLAMVGIVALALMSTFLTINLFWRLDDVKMQKEIIYDGDFLSVEFKNKGRPICDMKASFMLHDEFSSENIGETKEYYMPMLLKNSLWHLKLNLNETFWYKAVYELLSSPSKKLYCIFSFVDTKSGQSSIKVEEITRQNIKNNSKLLEYEEFIKPTIFPSQKLLPIENGGRMELLQEQGMANIEYKFRTSSNDSFVMAYYNFHNNVLNLEKYNKETTYLEFNARAAYKLNINLEIKLSNSNIITKYLNITDEGETIRIYLKDISDNLENITEICFTIFARDNYLSNRFQIGDLRIVTQ